MTPAPLPRRKPGLTVVFLGVVALGLAAAWLVDNLLPDPGDVAEVGAKAPDFSVELIDGGNFHLGSHLDQVRPRAVVVNLWASWCEPCRREMPALSAFADAHPDVTVIGVAVQDREQSSRAFAAEIGATYPLALGDEAFEEAYPSIGLPATFVIDTEGFVFEIRNGEVTFEDLENLVPGL